jgi:predicted transcriptional regulator
MGRLDPADAASQHDAARICGQALFNFGVGLLSRMPKPARVTFGNTRDYPMTGTTTTSLKLDAETKRRLRQLAEARRRSSHWLMREAIEQYLEREERREQIRQDALAAWAAYRESGEHVTAEEADAWLARLEAGEDVEPPPPHR